MTHIRIPPSGSTETSRPVIPVINTLSVKFLFFVQENVDLLRFLFPFWFRLGRVRELSNKFAESLITARMNPRGGVKRSLALLSAGHFMSDLYTSFVFILLPVWLHQFNQPFSSAGWLVFLRGASMAVFEPIGGYFADRTTKLLFPVGLALTALAMSSVGSAPSFFVLVFLILVATIGQSFFGPQAASEARKSSGKSKGFGLAIFLAGGTLGGAFGSIIIASLVTVVDLRATWLLLVPGLLITALLFKQFTASITSVLKKDSPLEIFAELKSRPLIALASVLLLRGGAETAIMVFLPILVDQRGYGLIIAGASVGIFKLFGALGSILAGFHSDRRSWKPYAVTSFLFSILILYSALKVEGWLALALVALLGVILLSSSSYTLVVSQNLLPNKTSIAAGLVFSISLLGGGLGSLVTGFLADILGLETAVLVTGVIMALGAAVATLGIREHL
jgi:FSR family fosmidomycin resistance protein-like MFS transporter